MSAYPLYAILMYLSILFAPPEADRISIKPPGGEPEMELVRNGGKWEFKGNFLTIEGESLTAFGEEGRQTFKITDFVALPSEHDWKNQPLFTLGGGNTMEKVATGFTIRRNDSYGDGNGVYEIRYHKPITVNVLGEVVNQGAHAIRADGRKVQDAITAAGGLSANADMRRVSIVRGSAGLVPEVTIVDLTESGASGPRIQAGDTIHVPKSEDGNTDQRTSGEITALAEQWLAAVDDGRYEKSWNKASEFFRNSITAEAWADAAKKFREPLGVLKSRTFRDSQKADALPGAPDGKYVILQFETSFAAKAEAVETVTFMLEKDGSWKAAGYFVR